MTSPDGHSALQETKEDGSLALLTLQVREDRWKEALPNLETVANKMTRLALEDYPGNGEICLVLMADADVQALNKSYRGVDKPTNVLSFPADEDFEDDDPAFGNPVLSDLVLGDIVFAFETVQREAKEQDKNISDHFSHLLVHGVLHLLGYDHENERDAGQMEDLERKILKRVGISDPYRI
jgi:probable rRNA maturation factor